MKKKTKYDKLVHGIKIHTHMEQIVECYDIIVAIGEEVCGGRTNFNLGGTTMAIISMKQFVRSRGTLRTPNSSLEPKNEKIHLHRS